MAQHEEKKDAPKHPHTTHKPAVPPEREVGPAEDTGLKPMPVADAGGPVPRVIDPNERAPEGLKRFKIRALGSVEAFPQWYVLAKDEKTACEHYNEKSGITKRLERQKKASPGVEIPAPELVVKELPD